MFLNYQAIRLYKLIHFKIVKKKLNNLFYEKDYPTTANELSEILLVSTSKEKEKLIVVESSTIPR